MISVLTPSLLERAGMLEECRESVAAQIVDLEHLVLVDEERFGTAVTVNRLARQATGEWLFVFADDDLMGRYCLPCHLAFASEAVDVVFSAPIVEPAWYCPECGARYQTGISPLSCKAGHPVAGLAPTGVNVGRLRPPVLPASALIRRSLWERLGGYDEAWTRGEDQEFWIRAVAAGARFVECTQPGLWTVRRHPGCMTWGPLTAVEERQWLEAGVR